MLQISSCMFLPKISKIGRHLTKVITKIKRVTFFFWDTVYFAYKCCISVLLCSVMMMLPLFMCVLQGYCRLYVTCWCICLCQQRGRSGRGEESWGGVAHCKPITFTLFRVITLFAVAGFCLRRCMCTVCNVCYVHTTTWSVRKMLF